jgi:hypothetical protein
VTETSAIEMGAVRKENEQVKIKLLRQIRYEGMTRNKTKRKKMMPTKMRN